MENSRVRNGRSARLILLGALAAAFLGTAFAHEGHDHAPVPGEASAGSGPIELSEQAIANLGIETIEANLIDFQSSLEMLAQIAPLPERTTQITSRFEGTVSKILAKLGENVEANQPLLVLAPRSVGNPPVTLRSPIAGVVTQVNATLGQAFAADTSLMAVADYSKILARGTAYESPDILRVKIGDVAKVNLDVLPDETFTGKIQRTDVGLEANAKTFEVYALLDNPGLKLRPNLFGTMSVQLGNPESVLAIPRRAVLGDMGNLFAFVRDGKAFERRAVILGKRSGDRVEILEGILPGEQVVTRGNYQLQYAVSSASKQTGETKGGDAPSSHGADREPHPPFSVPFWAWALSGAVAGALLTSLIRPRKN